MKARFHWQGGSCSTFKFESLTEDENKITLNNFVKTSGFFDTKRGPTTVIYKTINFRGYMVLE